MVSRVGDSKGASVDLLMGVEILKKVGEKVKKGDSILKFFLREASQQALVQSNVDELVNYSPDPIQTRTWVREVIE